MALNYQRQQLHSAHPMLKLISHNSQVSITDIIILNRLSVELQATKTKKMRILLMALSNSIIFLTLICTSFHLSRWWVEIQRLEGASNIWSPNSTSRRHQPLLQHTTQASVWSREVDSSSSSRLAEPFTRQDTARRKGHLEETSSIFNSPKVRALT